MSTPSRIERYLSGAVEYDALSDAEKCAVCAAMEGEFVAGQYRCLNAYDETHATKIIGARYQLNPAYLHDGTAALRLVERFKLAVIPWCGHWAVDNHIDGENGAYTSVQGANPQAAIVRAVCDLARQSWPYKAAA